MPDIERVAADTEPDLEDVLRARKAALNKKPEPQPERHPNPDKPASNTTPNRSIAFPITQAILDELTARKYLESADHADDYAVLRALFGMLSAAVKADVRADEIEVPQ
jgi:hypothetical protein